MSEIIWRQTDKNTKGPVLACPGGIGLRKRDWQICLDKEGREMERQAHITISQRRGPLLTNKIVRHIPMHTHTHIYQNTYEESVFAVNSNRSHLSLPYTEQLHGIDKLQPRSQHSRLVQDSRSTFFVEAHTPWQSPSLGTLPLLNNTNELL